MKFQIGQLVYHLPALESATWGKSIPKAFVVRTIVDVTDHAGSTRSYGCAESGGERTFAESELISADDPKVDVYREKARQMWKWLAENGVVIA